MQSVCTCNGTFDPSAFTRGNQSSSELDDWLQAEEEIRSAEEQAIERRVILPVEVLAGDERPC